MIDSLSEVESSIVSVKTELESLDTELQDLHWKVFEKVQDNFNNLHSEIDNLVGLFDDVDITDDNGSFSKEALSNLGLLAQKYELAQYQISQYEEQIEKLNQEYLDGKYSLLEYQEKLAELSSAQWDCVNSSEAVEDAIVSLHETRVEKEIESINQEIEKYDELIQAQIDALDKEKELRDYQNSIEEKSKSVTDLQKQISILDMDDSASAIAKRKLLEEELSKAKQDLEDAEYDHSIEIQKQALQDKLADFKENKDSEIEALEESLEQQETLMAESFELVKQNATLISQEIANITQQHGVYVSDTLISSWDKGEDAIASYGSVLSSGTSAFIGNLIGVENEVYALQAKADETAYSLAWMFASQADNLVNELQESYYAEWNTANMANALQQSLVNALERGYNVSGITSALNAIEDAANRAASAVASVGDMSDVNTPQYVVVDNATSNQIGRAGVFNSSSEAQDWIDEHGDEGYMRVRHISGYAKGTRSTEGNLIVTNEEGYELILPKLSSGNYTLAPEASQVLTKAQTDNIFEWAKFDPSVLMKGINLNTKLPNLPTRNNLGNTLKIDNLVTINGNVDDTNIKRMEIVAQNAVTKAFRQFTDELKY